MFAQQPFVQVEDDPAPGIHGFKQRERRMPLAHDMAEVRIGGERGGFVEDRLPHGRLHRLAQRVVAQFEILAHLGIREGLQARRAERGMGEKRSDL